MKRLILALGVIITMALTVTAQGVDGIKRNSSYLYGEGGGVTLQAAKEAALADLIQKISVTVHSDFTSKERELNQDGNVTSDAEYQSIIRSYSTATLTNVKTIVLKPEPDASVFLYIAKSEIDRIFESRVAKAKEFVGNADEALKNGQIDDALRYYYWSYCLVKSLRYPNEAKIFVDGQERSLLAWLPTRIDDVMGKVKVQSRRTADNTYEITATYDGRPVRSMDYTYFDGVDNSPVYSILDGKGLVELRPGMAMDAVQLKLEYEFRGLSRTRIVGFLEDYRTAYATKNLEYLDKVFDDNAVIVLGKRLQVAPQLNKEGYMNNHRVQFTQLTKREFLRNLRRQFQSKDYINLHFSQNRIYQLQKGVERYGIEIKQDYYSSNYGDTGYLTLIFDLTNPDQPVIHVRTWQEQPDPNFGVVSPADF